MRIRSLQPTRGVGGWSRIAPTQIGGIGGSSGGYRVSMMCVLDGKGDPDDHDPINRVSSKLQSVVALYTAAEGQFTEAALKNVAYPSS